MTPEEYELAPVSLNPAHSPETSSARLQRNLQTIRKYYTRIRERKIRKVESVMRRLRDGKEPRKTGECDWEIVHYTRRIKKMLYGPFRPAQTVAIEIQPYDALVLVRESDFLLGIVECDEVSFPPDLCSVQNRVGLFQENPTKTAWGVDYFTGQSTSARLPSGFYTVDDVKELDVYGRLPSETFLRSLENITEERLVQSIQSAQFLIT